MAAADPAAGAAAKLDLLQYRKTLGSFATGVTVMTTCTEAGAPVGLTCNSFNSMSLSPPLVLWSLRADSHSLPFFLSSGRFAVNILAADQQGLSQTFASPREDRFAGVAYRKGETGMPLLDGVVAHLECRLQAHHPGGDHVLLIGEVLHHAHNGQAPLVFHAGQYTRCAEAVSR